MLSAMRCMERGRREMVEQLRSADWKGMRSSSSLSDGLSGRTIFCLPFEGDRTSTHHTLPIEDIS